MPETATTHNYEAMFILDARAAKKDLEGLIGQLDELLTKHGLETAASYRWGERRFAYEINRQKKGFYILYHLRSDPSALKELKRDLGLFEPLLREHFLRIETIPETFEFPSDPEDRRDGRPGGPREGGHDRGPRRDRDRDGDAPKPEAKAEAPKAEEASAGESADAPKAAEAAPSDAAAAPEAPATEEKPGEGA